MTDIFKYIPNTNNQYVVFRSGIIYSLKTEKILSTRLRRGYPSVRITINGKSKDETVHRIVLTSFVGKKEKPFQINHIDGNKQNNHLSNLEWVTPKQNYKHRDDNNLQIFKRGENHHSSKVCDNAVLAIRKLCLDKKYTQKEIAGMFNMTQSSVNRIHKGKSRTTAKAILELNEVNNAKL
jgi:predicted XRE-type DNA-binding protein